MEGFINGDQDIAQLMGKLAENVESKITLQTFVEAHNPGTEFIQKKFEYASL